MTNSKSSFYRLGHENSQAQASFRGHISLYRPNEPTSNVTLLAHVTVSLEYIIGLAEIIYT